MGIDAILPRLQSVEPNPRAHTHQTDPKIRLYELIIPLAIGLVIALVPVPAGLSVNAWRYFALFATVIVALITEPIPPAIIGMAG
ncbi:MAG TPA: anion permease, partial [Vicinamibacterales bacterium]